MATIQIKVNGAGLLNYAQAGRDAGLAIQQAMRRVLNVGRTAVRRQIAAQFTRRTGFLARQSRKMQTKVSVKASEIKGQITPLPRLLNIFEHGAQVPARTNAPKNGHVIRFVIPPQAPIFATGSRIGAFRLAPRPIIAPASRSMEAMAKGEFGKVLQGMGK